MNKVIIAKGVLKLGIAFLTGLTAYPLFLNTLKYDNGKEQVQDISVDEINPDLD